MKTPKQIFIDKYCKHFQVNKRQINSEACSPFVTSEVVRDTFKIFEESIREWLQQKQQDIKNLPAVKFRWESFIQEGQKKMVDELLDDLE